MALIVDDEGWQSAYKHKVTRQEIIDAIAEIDRACLPASDEEIRKGLHFLADLLGARLPQPRVLSGYVSILRDVPGALLPEAFRAAGSMDAIHIMPTPGAIMKPIRPKIIDMQERRRRLQRWLDRMDVYDRFRGRRP